jgi:hypothetical protein
MKEIKISDFLDDKIVENIVKKNFGRKIKTMNVKCNTIIKGRYNPLFTPPFGQWFDNDFSEYFSSQIDDALERVNNEIVKIMETNEYRNRNQEALTKFAIEDISSVLMKYNHLNEDTIREAIKKFVIDSVLEI